MALTYPHPFHHCSTAVVPHCLHSLIHDRTGSEPVHDPLISFHPLRVQLLQR